MRKYLKSFLHFGVEKLKPPPEFFGLLKNLEYFPSLLLWTLFFWVKTLKLDILNSFKVGLTSFCFSLRNVGWSHFYLTQSSTSHANSDFKKSSIFFAVFSLRPQVFESFFAQRSAKGCQKFAKVQERLQKTLSIFS